MEPHSLVLLSGSTLDACHHKQIQGNQTRKAVPLRRPLRNLAQGLARLLPPLRQLSRRLRRTGSGTQSSAKCPVARTCTSAFTEKLSASSLSCSSGPPVQELPAQHNHHQPRWRTPRWQRAPHKKLQGHATHQQEHHLLQQEQHVCSVTVEQPEPLLLRQRQRQQEDGPRQAHEQQQQNLAGYNHTSCASRQRVLRRFGRLLRIMGSQIRPQGPGDNDRNLLERVLNMLTCGMFFQAGGKIVRLCRSFAARRFGWAFMVVGAVATVYHGSWGRIRPIARKADYYAIAASSWLLRRAVVGAAPRWQVLLMLAVAPFRPTLVSSSNFVAVEVRFLLLTLSQRQLLSEWAAHTALSAAATACFTLEDMPPLAWFPYTHAAFHLLSAAAFMTLPSALNHLTTEPLVHRRMCGWAL